MTPRLRSLALGPVFAALALCAFVGRVAAAEWAVGGAVVSHDPSLIREGSTWWIFETGSGLPVKHSPDGLTWTQGVRLFEAELSWWRTHAPAMNTLDVWAPDIQKFGDRYWCYYSVSEFGRNNSAIGLKSCTSIAAGDWRDDGLVISSKQGVTPYNAIDPYLTTDAAGNPWLAFGSWFDGIQIVPLDPATMKPSGPVQAIARRQGGIEGPNVVYAHGYYYLVVSIDRCCQGVNSTYKIAYGRSREITGPYVDKTGTSLLNGGGTVLEVGETRWRGPGGQDVYRDGDRSILIRHSYDANANGTPKLRIADLYWDAEAWPTYATSSAPVATVAPANSAGAMGSSVTLGFEATGADVSYRWRRNGTEIAGANSSLLTLANVQPADAGIYTGLAANNAGSATTAGAVVGGLTTGKVVGSGQELQPTDIRHPNGNIFDQVLLTGSAEAITADFGQGQVTRTSYIDLDDDIVQVELSGPGTLTLVLDASSGPARPTRYNQTDVQYMKGHASIVVVGADERTNVSVFTVGRATAFDRTNQFKFLEPISATNNPANNGSPLFEGHGATDYDGIADIAFIAIASANGKFGGVRTSNANYFASKGVTGIYAPGVAFQGPVYFGDISAAEAATPMIVLGSASDVRVTGGDMLQMNGQAVQVSGITQLKFTAGGDSHGRPLTAQANRAVYQQNGADVTAQIVANP